MTAMSNKMPKDEPGEIEALLPWHAAGTLDARDAKRVDEAMAKDSGLARQFAAIQEEYAATINLNESLGAPSSRAMQSLFAAIDAEPPRSATSAIRSPGWLSGFLASLSPRTLAASAAVAGLAIVLQAGVIGTVLFQQDNGMIRTASDESAVSDQRAPSSSTTSPPAAVTRSLSPQSDNATRLLVRFVATARVSDIIALLETYQGTIVESGKDGLFRVQFGSRIMNKDQAAGLIRRLENEKIVSMAMTAP